MSAAAEHHGRSETMRAMETVIAHGDKEVLGEAVKLLVTSQSAVTNAVNRNTAALERQSEANASAMAAQTEAINHLANAIEKSPVARLLDWLKHPTHLVIVVLMAVLFAFLFNPELAAMLRAQAPQTTAEEVAP